MTRRTPKAKLADPHTTQRGETAPYKKDNRMPSINKRTEDDPFFRDPAQPTHACRRPRSWLCMPNWIRQSDARVISKGDAGIVVLLASCTEKD